MKSILKKVAKRLKRLVFGTHQFRTVKSHAHNFSHAEEFKVKNTVIVRISGGLCNQIMCYTTARMVADWNKASLLLVFPGKAAAAHWSYYLDRYPLRYSFATNSLDILTVIRQSCDVFRITSADLFQDDGSLVTGVPRHRLLEKLKNSGVIEMDFSLPLYFWRLDEDEFRPDRSVLSDVTLNPELSLTPSEKQVMRRICHAENPVAVHVRRNDFLAPENDLAVEADYYRDAMQYVLASANDAEFFVFSDDLPWCRTEFAGLPHVTFVDNRGPDACTSDLFLGSLCRHFILTNHSTFSHFMAELSSPDSRGLVVTNGRHRLITSRVLSEYFTPHRCHVL